MSGSTFRMLLVLTLAGTALAACGKRGNLEPPGYAAEALPPGDAASGTAVAENAPKPKAEKADSPFILDGLL